MRCPVYIDRRSWNKETKAEKVPVRRGDKGENIIRKKNIGANTAQATALCRAEGTEALCLLGNPLFSLFIVLLFAYRREGDWSLWYNERVLRFDCYASRRSQFAPVIFPLNHFGFADTFFFKWIFPSEAARKIYLKTEGNVTGKSKMIFLWCKGKL